MRSMKQTPRVIACALTLPLILTACASLKNLTGRNEPAAAPDAVSVFCQSVQPIRPSRKHDTAETLTQIDELNAVWVRLCRPN